MAVDPRTPCVIGVAQRTWRPGDDAPEPLVMWEQVARAAAADTGADPGRVLGALDRLQVLFCQSWPYDDPPGRLAERLGVAPRDQRSSGIGGTTPQQLLDEAATAMLSGELDVALVVGGEALATLRRLKKAGERPAWSHRDPERRPFPFEAPFHPAEVAHEVFQAWLTFPVWDIARRARMAEPPETYRRRIAELLAPASRIAAANPHAWFPVARTVEELLSTEGGNRFVGYPYTKYEVAVMDVDQASAVLVATHAAADTLGVPAERRVYLRGWCYATDPVHLAEHHDHSRSPAMAAASAEALARAGIGIDDVAHLELYSCFASSVHLALDALGMAPDDPRPFTVTGGLPFAGGPGSTYLGHAVATMAEVLRADPGSYGVVSGVGMHMTKHIWAVYSTRPGPVTPPDEAGVQRRLDAAGTRPIVATATGPATVATYTVAHGRDGAPEWGLAICDLPGGERCYARITETDLLAEAEATEWVGRPVRLAPADGDVNLVVA